MLILFCDNKPDSPPQNSGVRYISTSNITSFAIERRAGMLFNVTALREVMSAWLGDLTLSYHSIADT